MVLPGGESNPVVPPCWEMGTPWFPQEGEGNPAALTSRKPVSPGGPHKIEGSGHPELPLMQCTWTRSGLRGALLNLSPVLRFLVSEVLETLGAVAQVDGVPIEPTPGGEDGGECVTHT